jgi:hypothetical protein
VTSHMSTDVASVPLFWVLPLALYLLSLVIAFQTNPVIPHRLVLRAFPVCIVVLAAFVALNPVQWLITSLAVHVVAFFVTALMCHGELARRRPAARYLTNFYIWLSAGGLIGGVTTGLLAPHLFSWIAEYPILIVAAILCVPSVSGSAAKTLADKAVQRGVIAALAIVLLALFALKGLDVRFSEASAGIISGLLLGATVYC